MHARCDMCPSYSRVKSANVTKIVWCQVYCRLCSARSDASPSTHIYNGNIWCDTKVLAAFMNLFKTNTTPAGHVYARCIHFLCAPVIIHTHTPHTQKYTQEKTCLIYYGKASFSGRCVCVCKHGKMGKDMMMMMVLCPTRTYRHKAA